MCVKLNAMFLQKSKRRENSQLIELLRFFFVFFFLPGWFLLFIFFVYEFVIYLFHSYIVRSTVSVFGYESEDVWWSSACMPTLILLKSSKTENNYTILKINTQQIHPHNDMVREKMTAHGSSYNEREQSKRVRRRIIIIIIKFILWRWRTAQKLR